MGSAPGGVHVGGIPLHGLEHGLVFLAGLDAGHAEGDDLNAAEVFPLGGEHLVEGVSHFHGMAGQSRVADALLADLGKSRLQGRQQLGLELAVQRLAEIGVFHIAADIGVKQDGVGDAVAVLAKAPDADVHVDAGPLVHHPERHRAGGAVFVAGQLLGVDVVDPLVGGFLAAKGKALAHLGKDVINILGQPAAEQGGLGTGIVGVLTGLGAEIHHLALLHDEGALALSHGHDGAIGDDVLTAMAVGRAAALLFLAFDGQNIRRESTAGKVFFPLVAHHAGSGTQCCFDKTHKSNLLFAPASDFCRRFVQYSIPDGNCIANRLLQFGADGCRIWASTQIQGSL